MSEYRAQICWKRTSADFTYETYNRAHEWRIGETLTILASSAPEYRGDPNRLDPERALVSALSSCHMLSFLAIASRKRLVAEAYEDDAVGYLERNEAGKLTMARVILRPKVVWSDDVTVSHNDLAKIHSLAHKECLIANSVKTEVSVEPQD